MDDSELRECWRCSHYSGGTVIGRCSRKPYYKSAVYAGNGCADFCEYHGPAGRNPGDSRTVGYVLFTGLSWVGKNGLTAYERAEDVAEKGLAFDTLDEARSAAFEDEEVWAVTNDGKCSKVCSSRKDEGYTRHCSDCAKFEVSDKKGVGFCTNVPAHRVKVCSDADI